MAPKGAKTEVVLYLPNENWEHYRQVVGKSQALAFNVTDMKALHADLKAKGVKFLLEPDVQPWGTYAMKVYLLRRLRCRRREHFPLVNQTLSEPKPEL